MSETCPEGRIIGPVRNRRDRPATHYPGLCFGGCGRVTHGVSAGCSCSYLRKQMRLCRRCAMALDYYLFDYSRVEDAPFTAEEVREFKALLRHGARLALKK